MYDHTILIDFINDMKWRVRETKRIFKDMCFNQRNSIDEKNLPEVILHQNSNTHRSNLIYMLDFLEQFEKKIYNFDPSTYVKRKMDKANELIKALATENVCIKKEALVLNRKVHSTYCLVNEQIAGQISIETHLEECRAKLKEQKKANKQLQRQVLLLQAAGVKSKKSTCTPQHPSTSSNSHSSIPANDENIAESATTIPVATNGTISVTATSSNYHADVNVHVVPRKRRREMDEFVPSYINRWLRKEFPPHGVFDGFVQSFTHPYYHVYYPKDGDAEDMRKSELEMYLQSLPYDPSPS